MGLFFELKRARRERARVAAGLAPKHAPVQSIPIGQWDFWGAPGRILAAEPCEARPHSETPSDGALRIAQGCGYDPGSAAYRFHTAVNETTKHASTFVRFGHTNPFCDLRQIDGDTQIAEAKAAVYRADVIHSHADYLLQARTGFRWRARSDQLVIRHYHGTRPGNVKQWPTLNMLEDDLANAVLVGARLTLCAVRPSRMEWLPIAVPVARYAALRPNVRQPGPFRIAHSPTRADYKGTGVFLDVCDRLNKRGVKVEPVLIGMKRNRKKLELDRREHGEALRIKATCDAVFDSFWLGIQGSGLEGGAMGLPVIAGDPDVAGLYREHVGHVPYTFANDAAQLEQAIEMLATEGHYCANEAMRVWQYVADYHDYAAVAERYERIIAKVTGWQNVATVRPHVAA